MQYMLRKIYQTDNNEGHEVIKRENYNDESTACAFHQQTRSAVRVEKITIWWTCNTYVEIRNEKDLFLLDSHDEKKRMSYQNGS
jgi:hypothetical protein